MKKIVLLFAAIILVFGSLPAFAQKISGVVFMDYFHNVGRDATTATISNSALNGSFASGAQKDLYGFQLRRIFFTVDYDLSNSITSRFRLEADGSALTANGKIAPFVRDLYVEAKDVFKGSNVVLGLQSTLGYGVSESVWGYRSLEKTIMDLRGILSSRDFAATLKGKIDEDGMVNYGIQYGNAADANESDKYKRASALIHAKPVKNLNISLYAEQKWQAADKNMMNLAFFAGYSEKDKYGVGVEYMMSTTKDGFTKADKSIVNLVKNGLSVFGNYAITPELVAVARYDMFDPNTDGDTKGDSRNYIVVGLDWKVNKKFSVIPNIQMESYEEPSTGKKYDASLNARVTFVVSL